MSGAALSEDGRQTAELEDSVTAYKRDRRKQRRLNAISWQMREALKNGPTFAELGYHGPACGCDPCLGKNA